MSAPEYAVLALSLLVAPGPLPAQDATQAGSSEQFAVIVHPSTATDDLSLTQLRRVFLGQQQFWPGGSRVVLFVHPAGTAEGAVELRHLYQMSENDFKRYWIAKTFRDDVTTGPKLVSSTQMAKRLTASIPGAIAVIPTSAVDSTVKVLSIDRRRPGADDYPLTAKPREPGDS
jgi:phosphate transport system substrate-binding protein